MRYSIIAGCTRGSNGLRGSDSSSSGTDSSLSDSLQETNIEAVHGYKSKKIESSVCLLENRRFIPKRNGKEEQARGTVSGRDFVFFLNC